MGAHRSASAFISRIGEWRRESHLLWDRCRKRIGDGLGLLQERVELVEDGTSKHSAEKHVDHQEVDCKQQKEKVIRKATLGETMLVAIIQMQMA